LFAFAGVPKEIITQLNTGIAKSLRAPDSQERLARNGAEPGRQYARRNSRAPRSRPRETGEGDRGRWNPARAISSARTQKISRPLLTLSNIRCSIAIAAKTMTKNYNRS
jgi:hypothetical protein